jgi:hypothetical protein
MIEDEWTEAARRLVPVPEEAGSDQYPFELGGSFILDTPADPAPL